MEFVASDMDSISDALGFIPSALRFISDGMPFISDGAGFISLALGAIADGMGSKPDAGEFISGSVDCFFPLKIANGCHAGVDDEQNGGGVEFFVKE